MPLWLISIEANRPGASSGEGFAAAAYFTQGLAATPLGWFEPVDIPHNRRLREDGKEEDCLLAYRTKGDDMRKLHQALSMRKGTRKPKRRIETPSKTQAEVLSAFGHYMDDGGVLQRINP